MAKSHGDSDFISSLKSNSHAAGTPMHLNKPPQRSNRAWDDVLSQSDASAATSAGPEAAAPSGAADSIKNDRDTGFYVPLDCLLSHPWNARVHRTPERIRQIASMLASSRQHHPISVVPAPEQPGKFFVLDGETRWKGAAHLHWKDIWAIEVQVDPNDAAAFYVESFKQTDATNAISPIDRGLRWHQLIEAQKATLESISAELEVSKGTVSKMLAYSKFPTAVVDYMQANADHFPYTVASTLAPLCSEDNPASEDELLSLCRKIVDEDFSRRAVEDLIKSRNREARSPRRSAVVSRTIKSGGLPVGSLRTYENGAIEFKFDGSAGSQTTADQLSEILQLAADLLSADDQGDFRSALAASIQKAANGG